MMRMLTVSTSSQRLTWSPGESQRSQPLEERIFRAIGAGVGTVGGGVRLLRRYATHEPDTPPSTTPAFHEPLGHRAHGRRHRTGDGEAGAGADVAWQGSGRLPLRLPTAHLGAHPPSLLEYGGPPLVHGSGLRGRLGHQPVPSLDPPR